MRVEIPLYDGFDELDALAPYELLARVDALDVRLVHLDGAAEVVGAHGTVVRPAARLAERCDLVVVPGGGWAARAVQGARAEVEREALPAALARLHEGGATVASVCTGAMLLAAAGLLDGRPATTHHVAVADLRATGARVVEGARVVDDGDVVTAGGVTSGLDLALWLVERELGPRAAYALERGIEYERRGTVWRRSQAGPSR